MAVWEMSEKLVRSLVPDGQGFLIRSIALTLQEADDWVAQDRTDAESLLDRLGMEGRLEKTIRVSGQTVLIRWCVYPWSAEG